MTVKKINCKPVAMDLFSGAGGLSEGFIMAGFYIAASVEKNTFAAETQRYNHTRWKQFRTKILNEDLRDTAKVIAKLQAEGVESVDAVIGGPLQVLACPHIRNSPYWEDFVSRHVLACSDCQRAKLPFGERLQPTLF